MKHQFFNTSFSDLLKVPLPAETNSYKPVAHADVRNEIMENLSKHNLQVHNEHYKQAMDGKRVIGYINLVGDNGGQGMRLVFRNSYDKSMSLAFVGGTQVWICSNGMISGDIQFMRKHTGSIVSEMSAKIVNGIHQMSDSLKLHTKYEEALSNITISNQSELAGKLYIEHNVLTSVQMSILKEEINDPTFDEFKNNSAWALYNFVTHALKKSHPNNYMNNHIEVHKFFKKEFQL